MAGSHAHTLDEARAAKPRAQAVFENLAEVIGVGIMRVGDGYGLKVNLSELPPTMAHLPTEVDGIPVRVKVGSLDGETLNAAPEFEDVRARAEAAGVPFKQVWAEALAAYARRR